MIRDTEARPAIRGSLIGLLAIATLVADLIVFAIGAAADLVVACAAIAVVMTLLSGLTLWLASRR